MSRIQKRLSISAPSFLNIKKVLVIVIAAILCATAFCTNVFAENHTETLQSATPHIYGVDIPNSGNPGKIIDSRAIAECGGGSHDMLAHGWGEIYNVSTGKTVVSWGACAQCTKCNLVIVTQGEPGTGAPLGYYTTWQPNSVLTSTWTVIRQSSNNIVYTSSSTLPGIRFRYA